jgi:hypothetical protein
MRNEYKPWLENLKVREQSEDTGIDGKIILCNGKNVML